VLSAQLRARLLTGASSNTEIQFEYGDLVSLEVEVSGQHTNRPLLIEGAVLHPERQRW
jgi:hypothetical protein